MQPLDVGVSFSFAYML